MKHTNEDYLPGHVLDKTKKKAYKKLWKNYKKNIIKLAKKSTPYQYEDGLEMFIENLRFMYEYYKLGYNVWAMERKDEDPKQYKDVPTRAEILKQILDEYDAWQNCDDKYRVVHWEGGKANGKGDKFTTINPKTGETKEEQSDWWIEYKLGDPKATIEASAKEQEQHRKAFFELYTKYMYELWD